MEKYDREKANRQSDEKFRISEIEKLNAGTRNVPTSWGFTTISNNIVVEILNLEDQLDQALDDLRQAQQELEELRATGTESTAHSTNQAPEMAQEFVLNRSATDKINARIDEKVCRVPMFHNVQSSPVYDYVFDAAARTRRTSF